MISVIGFSFFSIFFKVLIPLVVIVLVFQMVVFKVFNLERL